MTPLRWFGVIVGIVLLSAAIGGRRRLRNGDQLTLWIVAGALVLVSATGWANTILNFFSFHKGNNGRILGALVFATFVVLLLVVRALVRTSSTERELTAVIEGLANDQFRKEGWPEKFAGHIAVVIPGYNEQENLGPILRRIPEEVCGLPTAVLVVDDGSRDGTSQIARAHGVAVVRHVINRGQGAAMRTGYRIVADTDAPIVVAMDSDGQHQPEEMERLVGPVASGDVDLTNGSRTLGHADRVHLMRDAGIVFFNRLISLLTRTHVTDCSNGYRAMRSGLLHQIVLRQNQFHNSEFLIEAIKRGVRTREVPVTVSHRLSGHSKKPAILRYGLGFTNAIVRTWLR